MKLLKKVLFVSNLGDVGSDTERMAMSIARKFDSEIIPLFVFPNLPRDIKPDAIRERARSRLDDLRNRLTDTGINTLDPIFATGPPFRPIIHHAAIHDVNVILMSAGMVTESGSVRLSATAGRVVQRSSKPVWLVRPGSRSELKRILCPVDFSKHSSRALRNAIRLAKSMGAELSILHVADSSSLIPTLQLSDLTHSNKIQEAYEGEHQTLFDDFLAGFDFRDVPNKAVFRVGPIVPTIRDVAGKLKADLIVMGSAGQTGLARMFVGSVAHSVLRDMPCSVITLKSEEAIRVEFDSAVEDEKTWLGRGSELLKAGYPEEALQQLQKVVERNPVSATAWEVLAVVHSQLGQEKQAGECVRRAEQIRKELREDMIEADIRRQYKILKDKY